MTEQRKQALTQAGIEVDQALGRVMNNEGLLERLLQKFLEDRNYSTLAEAMQNRQYAQALDAAHTLKGICGNLSMQGLYLLSSRLVDLLRQERWEEASLVLPELTEAYQAILDAV